MNLSTGRNFNVPELLRDLDRGLSLPAWWYTDPGVMAVERELIFHRSWQYIGRAEQVAKPGDFMTGTVGEIPVVIVRDEKGVHGFVNACRHRRHPVMSGCGSDKKSLQCPYHAWTYNLDGTLRAAPRCDHEEGFRKEEYPLLPVRVETWGPFIFANADLQAQPLSTLLAGLDAIVARSGLDFRRMKFHSRDEWSAPANWKVMLENYLECYHCPVRHQGFSKVIDVTPDAYTLHPQANYFSQWAPLRHEVFQADGKSLPYQAVGEIKEAQYHFLWPNFTININPGVANMSVDVWLPRGPQESGGFSETYFGEDVSAEEAARVTAFNNQVAAEDEALTNAVQSALRGGLPVHGRFLPKTEELVVRFQRKVLEAMEHAAGATAG